MPGSANDPYDLVVIGGGTAGLTIGKYGSRLGAAVAIVEADRLGGDCTWTGCVPSKGLLAAARAAAAVGRTQRFGLPAAHLDPEAPLDLARVLERVHQRQHDIYTRSDSPEHVRSLGCDVVIGRGTFRSPRVLQVGDGVLHSRAFCIATGSQPIIPQIPGIEAVETLTNHSLFALRTLPPRLAVLGGGAMGLEMAQAFRRLGSETRVLEVAPSILPREDPELTALLRRSLEAEGVVIDTGVHVQSVAPAGEGPIRLALGSGETVEADALLVAAGQAPNTAGLGLSAAGVDCDAEGAVRVDGTLRTSNPRIFAAGDVTGRAQFTHTAARDAQTVLRNALFPGHTRVDERVTPWAVFTDPEYARVGLSEAEAREQYGAHVRVSRVRFDEIDRAVLEEQPAGCLKLIRHAKTDKVLGAQIVGPAAGELIHEFVLAMEFGIPAHSLAATIHVYPSLSEAPRFAGMDAWMGRLQPRWVGWLRRAYRRWELWRP